MTIVTGDGTWCLFTRLVMEDHIYDMSMIHIYVITCETLVIDTNLITKLIVCHPLKYDLTKGK
jgi:hypothetical protein